VKKVTAKSHRERIEVGGSRGHSVDSPLTTYQTDPRGRHPCLGLWASSGALSQQAGILRTD
jgi:hypothetical protein